MTSPSSNTFAYRTPGEPGECRIARSLGEGAVSAAMIAPLGTETENPRDGEPPAVGFLLSNSNDVVRKPTTVAEPSPRKSSSDDSSSDGSSARTLETVTRSPTTAEGKNANAFGFLFASPNVTRTRLVISAPDASKDTRAASAAKGTSNRFSAALRMLNGNAAFSSRRPKAAIQASPVRGSSHPALSLAASLNGGKRFGTRVASRCDSFCASFATQKKGDASHDAGAGRVACAIPMTRQVVPASSARAAGSVGAPRDASRRARTTPRSSATSAASARTPPRVLAHHERR